MVLSQCNVFSKKGIFIIFPIIIALILVSSAVPSFAVHQSEKLTWQLVMISSYPACSNYHYQMTERYNEITQSYFGLYQLENTNFKPICMIETKDVQNFTATILGVFTATLEENGRITTQLCFVTVQTSNFQIQTGF